MLAFDGKIKEIKEKANRAKGKGGESRVRERRRTVSGKGRKDGMHSIEVLVLEQRK